MARTSTPSPRRAWMAAAAIVLVGGGGFIVWRALQSGGDTGAPNGSVIQTVRSGDLSIVVSAASDALQLGQNQLTLEFRSAATGERVDVGTVRIGAVMSMPGMVMPGDVSVTRTATPGIYSAAGSLGMAGTWNVTIEWDGPAGAGSAAFDGAVQ